MQIEGGAPKEAKSIASHDEPFNQLAASSDTVCPWRNGQRPTPEFYRADQQAWDMRNLCLQAYGILLQASRMGEQSEDPGDLHDSLRGVTTRLIAAGIRPKIHCSTDGSTDHFSHSNPLMLAEWVAGILLEQSQDYLRSGYSSQRDIQTQAEELAEAQLPVMIAGREASAMQLSHDDLHAIMQFHSHFQAALTIAFTWLAPDAFELATYT